jgi:ubiquinone/menaquinone biosynthesis C-methylase UbiE
MTKQKSSVLELTEHLTSVKDLYGEQDLSGSTLFAGGFINFGYWKNIGLNKKIDRRTRILSSKQLYKKVFSHLGPNENDSIIEIGCGIGNGCVLLHKEFEPTYIIGIDASPHQIERACKRHKTYIEGYGDSIRFINSSAESFSIASESITKAFSIEALQHFTDINDFLKSVYRVLKQKGKVVISTFFFRKNPSPEFLELFPNFKKGIDQIVLIDKFLSELQSTGFENIKCQSIGNNVWHGFNKWISQTEYKDTWDKNWIKGYHDEVLDYFVIEANKPATTNK